MTRLMKLLTLNIILLLGVSILVQGFVLPRSSAVGGRPVFRRSVSVESSSLHDILTSMHESNYKFRIIVIGNGAILETTSALGPKFKTSTSPKTGEQIVTFASEDQSFEFHLKTEQVNKMALVEKERPGGDSVMQIMRFMKEDGTSICSLIAEADAKDWFGGLLEEYGSEFTF